MKVETGTRVPREPAIDLVRIISEGTYTSFPQALKEFISNSYDADATEVNINMDDECSSIVIRDNGVGMTLGEYQTVFASIARSGNSGARTAYGRTKLGRPKIGRFGIGALAVAGIAKKLTVRSTKRGSSEGFEAVIDLETVREMFFRGEDLSKHWKFKYQRWDGESSSVHFTEIQIDGLDIDVRNSLQRPGERKYGEFYDTTRKLSGADELLWQLGIICPVAYSSSYPIPSDYLDPKHDRIILDRSKALLKARFNITFNGKPVRRPISLPAYTPQKLDDKPKRELLLRRGVGFDVRYVHSRRGSPIIYEGYILVQAMALFPQELRGVLIRLRGVGIGWHRTFNIAASTLATMLPNMSGEIWVQGLEEALQFDRESFREDHPKYKLLRDEIIHEINAEETRFRKRSANRKKELQKNYGKGASTAQSKTDTKASDGSAKTADAPLDGDSFLTPLIFDEMPEYIRRIIPQINGCWEREYLEACAVMIRRLIEILIIELYFKRKWVDELKHSSSKDFLGLKALVQKICGDSRFGLNRRTQDGLKRVKLLGDIAAHDHQIRIRKSDLKDMRDDVRFTTERLVFKIKGTGP